MAGADWANGGVGGGAELDGGANGEGYVSVDPGEPGAGAVCAGAIPCGPKRPFICAKECVGARPTPSHAAAMAQRQSLPSPHPAIPAFLGFNRGNFKPNHPLHEFHAARRMMLSVHSAGNIEIRKKTF